MKPKFVSFEGGEGAGKSTQVRMLLQSLRSKNIDVIATREVGGCASAEKMREILLHEDILPMSELLQVMAARFEHVHKIIIPSLENNRWVICDRFVDSTAAYQGEELGADLIYDLHEKLISIIPDITFFIDIDPQIALERAIIRGENNKFEKKTIGFHLKVLRNFQEIAEKFPERIVRIEASCLNENEIHEMVLNKIN